jgi:hypothetical protein
MNHKWYVPSLHKVRKRKYKLLGDFESRYYMGHIREAGIPYSNGRIRFSKALKILQANLRKRDHTEHGINFGGQPRMTRSNLHFVN